MTPLAIVEIGARLLDKIIPDKAAREKAQAELLKAAQDQDFQLALGQIEVNKAEASHRSLFVASWRPMIGHICAFAMAWHFVLQPIVVFIFASTGTPLPDLPKFDMDSLMTVLLGMLGLGGLRTFEKFKGITK